MKKYNYLMVLFTVAMLFACRKSGVRSVQFDARLERGTYKVGDTVLFKFTGSVDFISLYSGERGHHYAYAQKNRITTISGVNVSFRTEFYNGAQTSDLMRVLYSKDFTGSATASGIDSASWVDITDRCLLPTAISNGSNPSAGFANSDFNILDIVGDGSAPVYLAFKYHIRGPYQTYGQRTNVRVTNFGVNYTNDAGTGVILNHAGAEWKMTGHTNYETEAANALSSANSMLSFSCAASPAKDKIAYAITKAIAIDKDVDEGLDRPYPVKGFIDRMPESYAHVFSAPGEYEVVFVAANAYADQKEEQVYKLNVTIVD